MSKPQSMSETALPRLFQAETLGDRECVYVDKCPIMLTKSLLASSEKAWINWARDAGVPLP